VKNPLLLRNILEGVGELVKISDGVKSNVLLSDVVMPVLDCLQVSTQKKRPFLLESALRTFGLGYLLLSIMLCFDVGIIIRTSGDVVRPLFYYKNLFRTLLDVVCRSSANLFRETLRVIGMHIVLNILMLYIQKLRDFGCYFAIAFQIYSS
jgi:hypothetical protein